MTFDTNDIISFKHVGKTYISNGKSHDALKDVNLNIKKRDIFGLIGTSGAGKSTLLRLILGLDFQTCGDIEVAGLNLKSLNKAGLRALRKNIGVVFQDFNLLESKSVYENVALPLVLKHEKKEVIHKRVHELLDFVGLEQRGAFSIRELSGGQKQRVGIARALSTRPDILLCDEATSALDPNTSEAILELLLKVRESFGVTIVFVTHTMHVITKICSHVAVLDGGEVVEQGSVLSLFRSPKSTVARSFVESVIPSKVPEAIAFELRKYQGFYKLLRIFFYATNATDDVIYKINTHLNVHTNVLFASVTQIKGMVLSIITMQITGSLEDYNRTVWYLQKLNIACEEVFL